MPATRRYAKGYEEISWKGCVNMANDVILAIRKINDRAKGLVKNLGADNPITQQYLSRMETLVPDQYLREDKNGVLQISRSKDFEKMEKWRFLNYLYGKLKNKLNPLFHADRNTNFYFLNFYTLLQAHQILCYQN